MATLYITEIQALGKDAKSNLAQIAQMPPVAEQTVAIGGASVKSNAFNKKTGLVRIHTDAVCSIAWGTDPTASAATARMAADQTEYFSVPPGQDFKIAVISNT
jgi:hypothetical protein